MLDVSVHIHSRYIHTGRQDTYSAGAASTRVAVAGAAVARAGRHGDGGGLVKLGELDKKFG